MRLRTTLLTSLLTLVTTLSLTALVVALVPPTRSDHDVGTGDHHTGSGAAEGHGHTQHSEAETTGTDEPSPALDTQLATARTVAGQWPTAGAAVADGWTLAEDYASQVGAHYMRYAEIDDVFDPGRPEMLLFGGDTPDSPIIGLAYYVIHHEPEGFVGSADMWHQHPNVCVGPDGPLWGADGVGVCATSTDQPVGSWAWMLHVWVIPEYESPQGVFSNVNLALP